MKSRAEKIQDGIYSSALAVEQNLVSSLAGIKAAKDAAAMHQPVDQGLLDAAMENHRAAHVRWENLVVSENSMGFHNQSEVNTELSSAGQRAGSAQAMAASAIPATLFPVPIPPTMTVTPAPADALTIHYDTAACNAADHALIIGRIGDFGTATSVVCSIGRTGSYTVPMPPGDAWFLVAGVEAGAYSSLGQGPNGERIVNGIPAACPAITTQKTTAICP
jgi:hypothetical protein